MRTPSSARASLARASPSASTPQRTYALHPDTARRPTSALRGVPHRIAVSEPYAPNCTASGPGLLGAVVGEAAHVLVVARDLDNRQLSSGGAVLKAHVWGGPGGAEVRSCDYGDGTYGVTYRVRVSGTYKLRITLTSAPPSFEPAYEEHICGSPFRLAVHDTDARALRYELRTATAACAVGGLSPSPSSPLGGLDVHEPLAVLSPSLAALAPASPTSRGQADRSAERAPIEVVAGQRLRLSLGAVDGATPQNAERFHVLATRTEARDDGAQPPPPPPEPRARARQAVDGTYTVEAVLCAAGLHSLAVSLAGVHVRGSPVPVRVVAARVSPQATLSSGLGLYGAAAGEAATIELVVRDAYGNRCAPARDECVFELELAPLTPAREREVAADTPARDERAPADARVAYEVEDTQSGDGRYVLRYRALRAGAYAGRALLNGQSACELRSIVVRPAQTDAHRSLLGGERLSETAAGAAARLVVCSCDQWGNRAVATADVWHWALVDAHPDAPRAVCFEGYLEAMAGEAGWYESRVRTERAGSYTLELRLGGPAGPLLGGSPFPHRVWPDTAAPARCALEGDGLRAARAGAIASVMVVARDAFGNLLVAERADAPAGAQARGAFGGAPHPRRFVLRLAPLSAGQCEAVEYAARELPDGRELLQFRATTAGEYSLEVLQGGREGAHVAGSPVRIRVHAARARADACVLVPAAGVGAGDGGSWRARVGMRGALMVRARDIYGNRLLRGGERFAGVLRALPYGVPAPAREWAAPSAVLGPFDDARGQLDASGAAVALEVRDFGNGNYELSFVPTRAGAHELAVILVDRQAADGGEVGTALGSAAPLALKHAADEAHAGEAAGGWIEAGGTAVFGSPWLVVVDAGDPSPPHSLVSGAGLASGTAGAPCAFHVVVCDAEGNACAPVLARDRLVVRAFPVGLLGGDAAADAGECAVQLAVTEARFDAPGSYSVTWTPRCATRHHVSASLDGVPLPNSPWAVEVGPAEPSARHSRLTHAPGRESAVAGERAEFALVLCDPYGNECSHASARDGQVTAIVFGPAEVVTDAFDLGDGRWLVVVLATRAGVYAVSASVRGEQLTEPPLELWVEPAASWPMASRIQAEQALASWPPARLGECARLIISANDEFGNRRLDGGECVEATVLPAPREPPAVRDIGDGTYEVTFVPAAIGDSVVCVSINGVQIGDSPHLLPVHAGPASARRSGAFGKALIGVMVNEVAPFVVQARDEAGNALRSGGDVVDVLIGAGSAQVVDLRDQGDGSYHCALMASEPGELELQVRLNGTPVAGSPFRVRVLNYELPPGVAWEDCSAADPGIQTDANDS